MPPCELRSLFWDVQWETFDPATFPEYTIARILEYGDRGAIAWLRRTFTEQQIASVISNDSRLTRKSANFWALVYNVPVEKVAALKRSSLNSPVVMPY